MKQLLVALFVAGSGFAAAAQDNQLPYLDKDFACISDQKAGQYINDFGVDEESFGGKELCNSQVDSKKLFNDLQIIEQGHFATNGSNKLIKGYVPADKYYTWMRSQTRGMDRGNDVPYATAYNRMGYFTMQDGWAKLSTLGRVGTVIHEARHTAGYRHYPCNQGPYMGARLDGCDENYQQAGSHAIEMEYYARVTVLGENFHPVYKSMARLMGIARTNFVFNQSPIVKREAVLALDQATHTPVLFDGNRKVQREGSDFVGRLKRTSFGAALFNGLQAVALEMYEVTGFRPGSDDDYSYFKFLKMNNMGSLKDLEEFDRNQKRYLAAVTGQNRIATYNFPTGQWNSLRNLPAEFARSATALPSGEQGYFVIDVQDQIYSLNPETQQVTSIGKKWDPTIQNVAFFNNQTLLLKTDGSIYQKTGAGSETLFDQGSYSDMVNVPLYDAFEVK